MQDVEKLYDITFSCSKQQNPNLCFSLRYNQNFKLITEFLKGKYKTKGH